MHNTLWTYPARSASQKTNNQQPTTNHQIHFEEEQNSLSDFIIRQLTPVTR